MKPKTMHVVSMLAFTVPITVRAAGQITNGGFEDLAAPMEPVGWNAAGSFASVPASFELFPVEGLRFGIVDALFAAPLTVDAAEMALNLPAGTVDAALVGNPVGVAAGWQQVDVNAGDVLEFNWAFMTLNPLTGANGDAGFVLIDDTISVLAMQPDATIEVVHSSYSRTDWSLVQFPINSTGTINIGFGVADGSSTVTGSQLLVDDVRIIPVPEPTVALMLLIGAMATIRRRSHR